MKPISVIALILAVFVASSGSLEVPSLDGLLDRLRPAPVVPDGGPVPPAEDLRRLVAPITDVLRGDRPKAVRAAGVYEGFAQAVSGDVGQRLTDVSTLRQVNAAAGPFVGLAGGPSIGTHVRDVLSGHLALERDGDTWKDRSLTDADRQKLAEAFRAISWAAMEAAR